MEKSKEFILYVLSKPLAELGTIINNINRAKMEIT